MNTRPDDSADPQGASAGRFARRGFLAFAGRILAGGAIAGLCGWLLSRGSTGGKSEAANECVNKGACANCGRVDSCGLPQGELARRWRKESGG